MVYEVQGQEIIKIREMEDRDIPLNAAWIKKLALSRGILMKTGFSNKN